MSSAQPFCLSAVDDLMLPYTVDLSQYKQLNNAELIAHIDRIGVIIYTNDIKNKPVFGENLAQVKA